MAKFSGQVKSYNDYRFNKTVYTLVIVTGKSRQDEEQIALSLLEEGVDLSLIARTTGLKIQICRVDDRIVKRKKADVTSFCIIYQPNYYSENEIG